MNIKKRDCRVAASRLIAFVLLLLITSNLPAQDFPHDVSEFPFINYEENKLQFFGDSSHFEDLFKKFDDVIFEGKNQVDIMHIGGSHVQAGVFSSQVRKHLQTIQPGLNSYRGFLFPYRVARTNNPANYRTRYSGQWTGCRNVERKKNCDLGLAGMSVTTLGSGSSIKISFNPDYGPQPFTKVKVYHPNDSTLFSISAADTNFQMVHNAELGFSELSFSSERDSIRLYFNKTEDHQDHFKLYGLEFENQDPGFAYHAIGVNGANVPAYLRCDLLSQHATSVSPDLVLFAIGINDANTTRFRSEAFKDNYDELIKRLKVGNPDLKIIFITNNDSYYRRRYPNENGIKVRKAMTELAEKHNAAVWDLFGIMGGIDSIAEWERYGLAQRDKIHFTRSGYLLVGDLLFSALIKSYERHLKLTYKN